MQAIARWGNFFNQELYGSPTTLPWGIPIDCAHRIAGTVTRCAAFPETTALPPAVPVRVAVRGCSARSCSSGSASTFRKRLRPGDLLLVFFIWYGVVRFALETFREDNWTFFGVPTAQIVSLAVHRRRRSSILFWRHRPGHPLDDPATIPAVDLGRHRAAGRPRRPRRRR